MKTLRRGGGREVARSMGGGGETMMRKMIERYVDTVGVVTGGPQGVGAKDRKCLI